MVHSSSLDDHMQRRYGLCFRHDVRKNSINQAFAKENLGRLHRRWLRHHYLGCNCKCRRSNFIYEDWIKPLL